MSPMYLKKVKLLPQLSTYARRTNSQKMKLELLKGQCFVLRNPLIPFHLPPLRIRNFNHFNLSSKAFFWHMPFCTGLSNNPLVFSYNFD